MTHARPVPRECCSPAPRVDVRPAVLASLRAAGALLSAAPPRMRVPTPLSGWLFLALVACAPSGPHGEPATGAANPRNASEFKTGDRVLCRYKRGNVEYPGRVIVVDQGRLLVDYDDDRGPPGWVETDRELIEPNLCQKQERY